jgi:uncharacterized LabA/DUF88 family protein
LRDRLQVSEAYYFIGYMPEQQPLYANLQRAGFLLHFKDVARNREGKAKGNVDVDLTLWAMDKIATYDQAVIVTSDGDFASLVQKANCGRSSAQTAPSAPISCAGPQRGVSIFSTIFVQKLT